MHNSLSNLKAKGTPVSWFWLMSSVEECECMLPLFRITIIERMKECGKSEGLSST